MFQSLLIFDFGLIILMLFIPGLLKELHFFYVLLKQVFDLCGVMILHNSKFYFLKGLSEKNLVFLILFAFQRSLIFSAKFKFVVVIIRLVKHGLYFV